MSAKRARPARWPSCAALGAAILVVTGGCTAPPTSLTATSGGATSVVASPAVDAAAIRERVDTILGSQGSYRRTLVRAVVVTVGGDPVVEYYRDAGSQEVTANTFSVTKSVVSMLVGIAIAEGSISGVDAKLADLLPDYASVMSPEVAAITLDQLLTMQGGFPTDPAPGRYLPTTDWTDATLQSPLAQEPGSGFHYSNLGAHLVSAIVANATDQPVLEYARKKLFGPLGIVSEPAAQPLAVYESADDLGGFAWPKDPQGVNAGWSELRITAADMASLGQLYLDDGQWGGEQVVPADWIHESTRSHVASDAPMLPGYGYLWWVGQAAGHPAFAAVGSGGQLVEVVADLELVVVFSTDLGIGEVEPMELARVVSDQLAPTLAGG